MKKLFTVLLVAALALAMSGCGEKAPKVTDGPIQLRTPKDGDTVAVFNTSMGEFKVVLFPETAPKSVGNFVTLAGEGYYDGLPFHRVEKDFVIQSGDPTGTGSGGDSSYGVPFSDEYSTELHHFTGAVGMAKAADDQLGSQFYIICGIAITDEVATAMKNADYPDEIIETYKKQGGYPSLDNRYTVFGQVYEGMDVVMRINEVKTDRFSRPTDEVVINSVKIETYTDDE